MTLASGRRWLAVGSSAGTDARAAGVEAATRALTRDGAKLRDDAKLVLVFASDAYDLPVLLRAVRSVSGAVPLIGGTTAGEISDTGATDGAVVVTALGGPGLRVETTLARDAAAGQRAAGQQAAACVERLGEAPHRVLLVLTDGLMRHQEEVIRGAYGVLGASVPVVGGAAGVGDFSHAVALFHGDEVCTDVVVAAAIGSDGPFGFGVHHGWRAVGEPAVVTRSDVRVHAIGDEPALDAYLGRLHAPPEAQRDAAAFREFALTRPLGVSRHSGEAMRLVIGADFDDRSVLCATEVPQGAQVSFMEGDRESVLDATDTACVAAVRGLGGAPPIGLLAFDCAARKAVLGESGIQDEVRRLAGHAAGAPIAGFYTFGEIARIRGINGFCNETMVILAVS